MSESSERAAWERPLTRRDVLLKVRRGGALAAGLLARSAHARRRGLAHRNRAAAATLIVANHGDMQNLDPYTSSADTVTATCSRTCTRFPPRQLDGTHNGARFAQSTQFRGQVHRTGSTARTRRNRLHDPERDQVPRRSPIDANAVKFSLDRCFDVKASALSCSR